MRNRLAMIAAATLAAVAVPATAQAQYYGGGYGDRYDYGRDYGSSYNDGRYYGDYYRSSYDRRDRERWERHRAREERRARERWLRAHRHHRDYAWDYWR